MTTESPLLFLAWMLIWFGLSALLAYAWSRIAANTRPGHPRPTCHMPGCGLPATHRSRRDASVLLCGDDAADEFYADMATKETQR